MSAKNTIKAMFIVCLFIGVQQASAQWTQLNSGTIKDLNEIFFPVSDTGYVAGESGTVLKTTDGGTNWIPLNTGTTKDFHDLFFLNSMEGWIVGDSGTICHTMNGGDTWTTSFTDSAAFVNLHAVCAVSNMDVLVGGFSQAGTGYMAKSIDGGSTWARANIETYIWTVDFIKIRMVNANIGYSLTRGMVQKTIDGGRNWFITDTASVHRPSMFSVLEDIAVFPNSDTAYVCGWYPAYFGKTVNGGALWEHDFTYDYYNLDFLDMQTGYVGGWGYMHKTTDGGQTFTDASGGNFGLLSSIYSIDFTDEWTGYACGENGKLIRTTNGGATQVEDLTGKSKVTLFPNPTNGQLRLSAQSNIQVSGISGAILSELKQVSVIDLSTYPSGVYFVTLKDNEGKILQRSKVMKTE